jgi:hypothetical protein
LMRLRTQRRAALSSTNSIKIFWSVLNIAETSCERNG